MDSQLCAQWQPHNDQLSLWMTQLCWLTKSCCLTILSGMEGLQVFNGNYWVYFPLTVSIFHLQIRTCCLSFAVKGFHFFLPRSFPGVLSLFFRHTILMYDILTSVTPPMTSLSLLSLHYCQPRFSMGRGLCIVAIALTSDSVELPWALSFL